MATETALKVNQERLVKNLRFSFTDATTVLGELMQNARRAGAAKVVIDFNPESKTLVVRDDGCGIDCFQTLPERAGGGRGLEGLDGGIAPIPARFAGVPLLARLLARRLREHHPLGFRAVPRKAPRP